jgi:hypothetical protein
MVLPETHHAVLKELAKLKQELAELTARYEAAKVREQQSAEAFDEESARADIEEAESYKKDHTIKKLKRDNDKLTGENKAAVFMRMAAEEAAEAQMASLNRALTHLCEGAARNTRESNAENHDD